jgi:hypothetical protein
VAALAAQDASDASVRRSLAQGRQASGPRDCYQPIQVNDVCRRAEHVGSQRSPGPAVRHGRVPAEPHQPGDVRDRGAHAGYSREAAAPADGRDADVTAGDVKLLLQPHGFSSDIGYSARPTAWRACCSDENICQRDIRPSRTVNTNVARLSIGAPLPFPRPR